MEKVKYAVIGVGNMGKNHARSVYELENIELVAVADTNIKEAGLIAKSFSCKSFENYETMLEECDIDMLSICAPTSQHEKIATACIKKGKHVLIEKPIAPTLEEAIRIKDLAIKNNITLMIGHIERFNPAVLKTKELIKNNEIGSIVSIMARRVGVFPPQIKDANIAIDLAIHDLDIISYLLDDEPISVTAHKKRNHIEHREDSVEFFLKYPQSSAYIQANWITPVKIRKLNITGTDGYIEMDYINQKIQFFKSNYEKYKDIPGHSDGFSDYVLKYMEPDLIEISVAKREPLKEEIMYFVSAARSKKNINIDFSINALATALKA
jgi:UDP-N-acetylglucosamine 3-dehydrogenase